MEAKYALVSHSYYIPKISSKAISHDYLNEYFEYPLKILHCTHKNVIFKTFSVFPKKSIMLKGLIEIANEKKLNLGFQKEKSPDKE